jgi:hypothetical protein
MSSLVALRRRHYCFRHLAVVASTLRLPVFEYAIPQREPLQYQIETYFGTLKCLSLT